MAYIDGYVDNIDATVTLSICDNCDGDNIIINLALEHLGSVGIALSAAQVFALTDDLRILAAGI